MYRVVYAADTVALDTWFCHTGTKFCGDGEAMCFFVRVI